MTERTDRLFAAAMAGYSYAEFTASESVPVPPVQQDRGQRDDQHDEHDGNGPVPLGVPPVLIGEDHG